MTEGSDRWFYGSEGQRRGPINRDALVDLLLTDNLAESTLVWRSGFAEWKRASEVPELRSEIPPPLPLSAPEDGLATTSLDFGGTDSSNGDTGGRKRRRRRRHRRIEERHIVVPRGERKVLLWAWPVILLAAVIVWLLLSRTNREPEAPLVPEVSSLREVEAVFLEEPLPQTAPERYTHANATGES